MIVLRNELLTASKKCENNSSQKAVYNYRKNITVHKTGCGRFIPTCKMIQTFRWDV